MNKHNKVPSGRARAASRTTAKAASPYNGKHGGTSKSRVPATGDAEGLQLVVRVEFFIDNGRTKVRDKKFSYTEENELEHIYFDSLDDLVDHLHAVAEENPFVPPFKSSTLIVE